MDTDRGLHRRPSASTLLGTVVPLALFYGGVTRLEASRVGVASAAKPAVTVALGAVVLGERVTRHRRVGALVPGGVLLVQRTRESGVGVDDGPVGGGP